MRSLIFTYFYLILFLSVKSDAFSIIKPASSLKEQSGGSVKKIDILSLKVKADRGIAKVGVKNEVTKTAVVIPSPAATEVSAASYNQSSLVSVKSFKEWKNEPTNYCNNNSKVGSFYQPQQWAFNF